MDSHFILFSFRPRVADAERRYVSQRTEDILRLSQCRCAPRGNEQPAAYDHRFGEDELRELTLAGRYGWHSVEVGANYHCVVRSGNHWEHMRVTLSPSRVRQLRTEGWEVIDSGFPYTYLKRDTGMPALLEPPAQ